jgi:undecaprenyl-diphosphatase
MGWFEAFVLALVQGLTEFLPISSSAHLILPSQVLGWEDQGLAFDVAVHVGTLLAIILYFRDDLVLLAKAWFRSLLGPSKLPQNSKQHARLAWLIVLATIPAGLAGLILNDFISEHLRSTLVIAATTIVFGLLLWFSDSHGARNRVLENIDLKTALLIGVSQALALIPGTSRSGITMTAALLLGLTRDAAARFSFLLSVPLIAAAGGLKTKELLETGSDAQLQLIAFATMVAFISAFFCIHFFLRFLERIGFMPFVVYRLSLGVILVLLAVAA